MYTNQDLVTLWYNEQKRQGFIKAYKSWGVWFTQPELDLTFYKYDLPGGGRLIVMEYLRSPYPNEQPKGSNKPVVCNKFYLQRKEFFDPHPASMYVMTDRLKEIKGELMKESAT